MKRGISGDQIINSTGERDSKLLLGEYIARGEHMLLYAPTGNGKTVNALTLGIALTCGGEFYGWKSTGKYNVLFIEGGELTANGIAERMRSIYRRQGITSDPNFHLKAPTKRNPFTFDITDPQHQSKIIEYVKEYNIDYVIFDNFNSLRKEQDNEFVGWSRTESMLNKFKTLGVGSCIVHHTNKEGEKQSGAQRKVDYVDCCIRIEKSVLSTKRDKYDKEGKLYVQVDMEKFRWGAEEPIKLTELVFNHEEKTIDMLPADYHEVMNDSIQFDLNKYGEQYVKEKYRFLKWRLHHYLYEEPAPLDFSNEKDLF